MTDVDTDAGGDALTADEQAAYEAYASGQETAAPETPAAAAETAPETPETPGEGAPEVVDPDAEGADDPEANKGRFVRHGAFHKERELRKQERAAREAAQAEVTKLREAFARADERVRLLAEARQAPAPAEEPAAPPDPTQDIFGAFEHQKGVIAKLEARLEEIATGQKQATEQSAQERAQQRVMDTYRQDADTFRRQTPDFDAAYSYLIQGRAREMQLAGVPDERIQAVIQEEEFQITVNALRRNQSPAAVAYALAESRGYRKAEPAPAAPAKPVETPAERVARVAAGQAVSKSLSAAGGQPAGELSMEALANMSEEEFEAYYNGGNRRRIDAIMGRQAA